MIALPPQHHWGSESDCFICLICVLMFQCFVFDWHHTTDVREDLTTATGEEVSDSTRDESHPPTTFLLCSVFCNKPSVPNSLSRLCRQKTQRWILLVGNRESAVAPAVIDVDMDRDGCLKAASSLPTAASWFSTSDRVAVTLVSPVPEVDK